MGSADTKHLQCTEVWGGNACVDRGVVMPGLEAYVYSQPCGGDAGGGDVHYVSSCAAGQIARLLLADVAGHGNTVAEVAARLRQLMRRHIGDHSQRGLVRAVNRAFTDVATGGMFATAVVMTFDAKRGTLLVSNAGHPPPLLFRLRSKTWSYLESGTGRDDVERPANLPLGIDAVSDYGQVQTTLDVGDVVVSYTDWLPEARNAAGEFLGKAGLLELARSVDVADPSRLPQALTSAVERWAGTGLDHDDVTLLLFRRNGQPPSPSIVDLALAPFRMIRSIAGSYLPAS